MKGKELSFCFATIHGLLFYLSKLVGVIKKLSIKHQVEVCVDVQWLEVFLWEPFWREKSGGIHVTSWRFLGDLSFHNLNFFAVKEKLLFPPLGNVSFLLLSVRTKWILVELFNGSNNESQTFSTFEWESIRRYEHLPKILMSTQYLSSRVEVDFVAINYVGFLKPKI